MRRPFIIFIFALFQPFTGFADDPQKPQTPAPDQVLTFVKSHHKIITDLMVIEARVRETFTLAVEALRPLRETHPHVNINNFSFTYSPHSPPIPLEKLTAMVRILRNSGETPNDHLSTITTINQNQELLQSALINLVVHLGPTAGINIPLNPNETVVMRASLLLARWGMVLNTVLDDVEPILISSCDELIRMGLTKEIKEFVIQFCSSSGQLHFEGSMPYLKYTSVILKEVGTNLSHALNDIAAGKDPEAKIVSMEQTLKSLESDRQDTTSSSSPNNLIKKLEAARKNIVDALTSPCVTQLTQDKVALPKKD